MHSPVTPGPRSSLELESHLSSSTLAFIDFIILQMAGSSTIATKTAPPSFRSLTTHPITRKDKDHWFRSVSSVT